MYIYIIIIYIYIFSPPLVFKGNLSLREICVFLPVLATWKLGASRGFGLLCSPPIFPPRQENTERPPPGPFGASCIPKRGPGCKRHGRERERERERESSSQERKDSPGRSSACHPQSISQDFFLHHSYIITRPVFDPPPTLSLHLTNSAPFLGYLAPHKKPGMTIRL